MGHVLQIKRRGHVQAAPHSFPIYTPRKNRKLKRKRERRERKAMKKVRKKSGMETTSRNGQKRNNILIYKR
jgi:hypothetical protein